MPRLVGSRTVDDLHWASIALASGARGMLGSGGQAAGDAVAEATREQYPNVTARDMVAVAVALEVAHGMLLGRLQNAGLSGLMGTVMSSFEATWQGLSMGARPEHSVNSRGRDDRRSDEAR